MLAPGTLPTPADIARHYDELGALYRQLWGDRLHHGVWDDHGDDHENPTSIARATNRLLDITIAPLGIQSGQHVLDIGCGYGEDARRLARTTGAQLTGLTLSTHQFEAARDHAGPSHGEARILHGDWLTYPFAEDSFQAAFAIESLSHMPDKPAFFAQLRRILVPGGRAAIADWTIAPDLSLLEKLILRRLCREGRLPSLGTPDEYRRLATAAGLQVIGHRDLTRAVEPTWWIIARRAVRSVVTNPRVTCAALLCALRRPSLLFTIPQMLVAYRTGALHYTVLWLERPAS